VDLWSILAGKRAGLAAAVEWAALWYCSHDLFLRANGFAVAIARRAPAAPWRACGPFATTGAGLARATEGAGARLFALGLAHHDRWLGFVLVDTNGHEANDVG